MKRRISWFMVVALALSAWSAPMQAAQKSLEELKAEADKATGGQQAKLCMEVARMLVDLANQQFADGNVDQAQATIQEVLNYAAKAHSAALQSHNRMKETEMALYKTKRRMEEVRHTLSIEDTPPLEGVEKKLEQFRQDLLDA